jgi:hypothetical protein
MGLRGRALLALLLLSLAAQLVRLALQSEWRLHVTMADAPELLAACHVIGGIARIFCLEIYGSRTISGNKRA